MKQLLHEIRHDPLLWLLALVPVVQEYNRVSARMQAGLLFLACITKQTQRMALPSNELLTRQPLSNHH